MLLRTSLATHSRLAVPPETHYFKLVYRHAAEGAHSPADFEAFWCELTEGRRFRDLNVDPADVLSQANGHGFRDTFNAMLSAYAKKEGKAYWGEKTSGHARYLSRIFA